MFQYGFMKNELTYIFTVQFSKIGNAYKGMYVMWPDGSHTYFDFELLAHFKCDKTTWTRMWMTCNLLTDEQEWEDILTEYGIRWPNFEELCASIVKEYGEQS